MNAKTLFAVSAPMSSLLQMPMMGRVRSWADAVADPKTVGPVADAVACFRSALKDRWNGWAVGSPLASVFHTSFQTGEREWVRLHNLVRALDGVADTDLVIRHNLGSAQWNEFVAGVETLQFCGRMHRAGHAVTFVRRDSDKSADAKITLASRPVTTEFKALHDSDEQKPWNDLFESLVSLLDQHQLGPSSFEIEFAPPALDAPAEIADELAAIAACCCHEFRELPMAAGRARFIEGLGTSPWFTFPVAQYDDLTRVSRGIKSKWWRQLDVGGPTLLVVRTRNIFSRRPDEIVTTAEGVRLALFDALSEKACISAVLIYEEPFWAPPPVLATHQTNEYRLIVGASPNGYHRTSLLVPNPVAAERLTPDELDVLVGPKMTW